MANAEPKRPLNPYWLWLSECWEALSKEAGQGKGAGAWAAAKLGGARWKVMSEGSKKQYEERYEFLRAEYVKAMREFKTAGGRPQTKRERMLEKASIKKSINKTRKDARQASGKPKRALRAYWIWLGENRDELRRGAVSRKGSEVAKFAGEKWNALADGIKAPFYSRAAELQAQYHKEMEEWRRKSKELGSHNDNDGDVDAGDGDADAGDGDVDAADGDVDAGDGDVDVDVDGDDGDVDGDDDDEDLVVNVIRPVPPCSALFRRRPCQR